MKKLFAILLCIGMVAGMLMGGYMMITSLQDPKPTSTEKKESEKSEPIYTTREKAYADLNSSLSQVEVKKRVKMNLDKEPFTSASEVKDPNSYTVLVNAYSKLPAEYMPEDLEPVSSIDPNYPVGLRKEAAQAFDTLVQEAKAHGFDLQATNGFISNENIGMIQEDLKKEQGDMVDDYVLLRPCFSEYQTGLAVDIAINGSSDFAKDDPNYTWLCEQLADHGFILRYPEGKEEYTLVPSMPAHLRYVGVDAARQMAQNHETLEENLG